MKVKKVKTKIHFGKIAFIFALCFVALCGFTVSSYAYASSSKVNAPISVTLTPNYDEGVISITLTPTGSDYTRFRTAEPLNIFAISGHKTINEIPVIDYEVDDLPEPCFKLVDTGITATQFFDNNKAVTYSFDSSVLTEGEEYTIFAYYQFVDAECEHFFSELYYYTYLVPVPLPPDPVKEGYTFVGWYYDEEFTQPYNGEPIYADTKLYAKFEINKYTVTFNLAGGEVIEGEAIQIVEYGNSAVAPTVTREGYRFIGWDKSFDNIKGDLIVTAQWERITYTVTFYVDGEVYDVITVYHGTVFIDNPSVQKIMQTLSAVYLNPEKTVLLSPTTVLDEDTVLYVDVDASLRKWLDIGLWFQKNWIWLAVGAGVLAFIVIVVIIKVKRG
ncbi:MAG TPA: InlB B-repeat-containing protein [Clostridia bacterium]